MRSLILALALLITTGVAAQNSDGVITLDRIYKHYEFWGESTPPIQWIDNGDAYVIRKRSEAVKGGADLIVYKTETQETYPLIEAQNLIPAGASTPIRIESFNLSTDEQNVIIFTNSSRVWRSNTKGDYWLYNRETKTLSQLGSEMPSSSLMFAKLSADNSKVAYVSDFNLYVEDIKTGKVKQLTDTGNGKIINGTFDWAYEEEFGSRDGFRWNAAGTKLAFWQLDASSAGTFYMINNTDSVYSRPIPLQYPKVGQQPSSAKIWGH